MPMFPPSLPPDVLTRAFKALNGEIGVRISDVSVFLTACKSDEIGVLGWEIWLADHSWDNSENQSRKSPVPGFWCGVIPEIGSGVGVIYAGEGNADECLSQISALDFDKGALALWREYICVNFTLD